MGSLLYQFARSFVRFACAPPLGFTESATVRVDYRTWYLYECEGDGGGRTVESLLVAPLDFRSSNQKPGIFPKK
jgi:hypothetical protein